MHHHYHITDSNFDYKFTYNSEFYTIFICFYDVRALLFSPRELSACLVRQIKCDDTLALALVTAQHPPHGLALSVQWAKLCSHELHLLSRTSAAGRPLLPTEEPGGHVSCPAWSLEAIEVVHGLLWPGHGKLTPVLCDLRFPLSGHSTPSGTCHLSEGCRPPPRVGVRKPSPNKPEGAPSTWVTVGDPQALGSGCSSKSLVVGWLVFCSGRQFHSSAHRQPLGSVFSTALL